MSPATNPTRLELFSDTFNIIFDSRTGTVQKLSNTGHKDAINFVLSAEHVPDFNVEDSRFLGDLIVHATQGRGGKGSTMTTGLSAMTRSITQDDGAVRVSYDGNSTNGGFNGISVMQEYTLSGSSREIFTWTITITNVSSDELELEDLGLPLLMNALWGNDQTENYERNVNRHSFIAMHGSYIYWQSPNGKGPILFMTPRGGTSLEYKTRYGEDERFGERSPEWEGLTEVYIHSKNVGPARSARTRQYLPATSRSLTPGQSCKYGFDFRFIKDHAGLHDALFETGSFDIVSLPGMVLPTDMSAILAVRYAGEIGSIFSNRPEICHITPLEARNGYELFNMTLTGIGETYVTITATDGRSTVLQYFGTEPIDRLIESHSSFLVQNQLAKSNKGYNGAFLQWDMANRKLLTWDNHLSGGWREWMVGGSDDLGLAPGAYLAEKCLISPNQEQIIALDYHIDNFLLGYLISARDLKGGRTYQVYRWYDGKDAEPGDTGIWRAYNYTHIANLFFNMYRLGKAYPDFKMNREPNEYLLYAYNILNAMYSKIPVPNPIGDAANTLGLMGESTVPEISEALTVEGFQCESAALQSYVARKTRYYQSVKYPFASEMTIDTTGFESVYAFSKAVGAVDLIEKTQNASIASRGSQPLWYYFGSDNRMMGEAYWNLSYETQLGAWQQQDYLIHYSTKDRTDFADTMRSTYGAYLAGWANINSGQIDTHIENMGAAAWIWQSEGGKCVWPWMPMIGCWWAWSGEADLGFWGALRTASVNVVQDPIVGLFAFGGIVELTGDCYVIEPRDGVQQRLTLFCAGNLTVRIERARYTKAIVARDGSRIELSVKNVVSSPCIVNIRLINALAGDYELTTSQSAISVAITVTDTGPNIISMPKSSTASPYTVTIRRK